jgi:hypothetical protein
MEHATKQSCRTDPGGRSCLLVFGPRKDWNCCVCRCLTQWRDHGFTLVLVTQARAGRIAYLYPASSAPSDEASRLDLLLELRLQSAPFDEIRATVNTLMQCAEETWIHHQGPAGEAPACIRIAPETTASAPIHASNMELEPGDRHSSLSPAG